MNDYELLLPFFVNQTNLAPEFDPAFYRASQADLVTFDEAALVHHYENHGRHEGRIASPAAHRFAFLAQIPRGQDRTILEVGPAVRPALSGQGVKYFEISDRAALLARAERECYDASQCPEEIHYVSPLGDLAVVGDDRFDAVLSSHCIEHQPDLIRHFIEIARILRPRGCYFMLVPDKRYCFDALLAESAFASVHQAFLEKRRVHTFESIYEHLVLTTHNEIHRHWQGDHADPCIEQRPERAVRASNLFSEAKGGYVDVHAWQFTPRSFRDMIYCVTALNLQGFNLRLERVYDTVFGRNEFGAVLRKTS